MIEIDVGFVTGLLAALCIACVIWSALRADNKIRRNYRRRYDGVHSVRESRANRLPERPVRVVAPWTVDGYRLALTQTCDASWYRSPEVEAVVSHLKRHGMPDLDHARLVQLCAALVALGALLAEGESDLREPRGWPAIGVQRMSVPGRSFMTLLVVLDHGDSPTIQMTITEEGSLNRRIGFTVLR